MEYNPDKIIFTAADFTGVKHGIKPVSRVGIDQEIDTDYLKNLCEEESLNLEIVESAIYDSKEKSSYAYIGKDKENIEDAIGAERKGDGKTAAHLFGYPDCCVEKYSDNEDIADNRFQLKMWENVDTAPHRMNSLFCLDSKVTREKIREEHFFHKLSSLSLSYLPYHPCSLDCSESLEMGKQIREKMGEDFPGHRKKVDEALKGPFLLIDDMNFAALEGQKDGNEIKYGDVKTDLTRVEDKNVLNALKKGNKVVENNGLEIHQAGEVIEHIEEGTLIQFQKTG
ncbi:MAG: DUF483 domain-containing protein [Candidatus Nanohaloarchaeota archaeon QJJ-7]|nr:DUF483 domain-containing protein [Candidatus Nanohaloarchaeota archaeon QJJ-7]